MPRPSVFTKDILQKLEQAFALDCTDEESCFYAGISPSSLYNYQQINPEFLERKRLLRLQPILKARHTIVRSLDDPKQARWYLERKRPEEFNPKLKIEYAMPTVEPMMTPHPEDEALHLKYKQELLENIRRRAMAKSQKDNISNGL